MPEADRVERIVGSAEEDICRKRRAVVRLGALRVRARREIMIVGKGKDGVRGNNRVEPRRGEVARTGGPPGS